MPGNSQARRGIGRRIFDSAAKGLYKLCTCIWAFFAWFTAKPARAGVSVLALQASIAVFNPFNLELIKDRNFVELGEMLTSPCYGHDSPWCTEAGGRVGQDEIIVILINESTLDVWDIANWPLPYGAQIELLERVAAYSPASLFFDVTYLAPHHIQQGPESYDLSGRRWLEKDLGLVEEPVRQDVVEFSTRLGQIRKPGIHQGSSDREFPIFVGPISEHSGLAPLRGAVAENSNLASVGISITDLPGLHYPDSDADGLRQAAYALYARYCDIELTCSGLDVLPQTMVVDWGYPGTGYGPGNACPSQVGSPFSAAMSMLWRTIFQSAESRTERNECAYHDFVYAQELFQEGGAEVGNRLTDRHVLVGADVSYLRDNFSTPVYGEISGVMVHAMAFDNLIEHGGRSLTAPSKIIGFANAADLFELSCALLIVLVVLVLYRYRGWEPEIEQYRKFALGMLVVLAIFFVGLVLGTMVFRWPAGYVFQVALSGFLSVGLIEHADRVHRGDRLDG